MLFFFFPPRSDPLPRLPWPWVILAWGGGREGAFPTLSAPASHPPPPEALQQALQRPLIASPPTWRFSLVCECQSLPQTMVFKALTEDSTSSQPHLALLAQVPPPAKDAQGSGSSFWAEAQLLPDPCDTPVQAGLQVPSLDSPLWWDGDTCLGSHSFTRISGRGWCN